MSEGKNFQRMTRSDGSLSCYKSMGTRQTDSLVLRLDGNVVAPDQRRHHGSSSPGTAAWGFCTGTGGLQITLHVDQLLLTGAPR